jgi:hypothetical protein
MGARIRQSRQASHLSRLNRKGIKLPSFIRHPKDFWTGIIFLAFGLSGMYIGQDYSMGQAAKMGPGYFPTILGGILAVIGAIGVIRSFVLTGEGIGVINFKGLFLVLASVLLFGFLMRGGGMVPAVFVSVMVSALASGKYRLIPTTLLAIGSTIFCILLFVKLLGLPIAAFGSWFGN